MRSNFKGKVILVGPPRSGTTIMGRFISSIESCFFLLEPFQTKGAFGAVMLPDGTMDPLDWDQILDREAPKYQIVGLKECYMPEYANVSNWTVFEKCNWGGYHFVYTIRDPFATFSSCKRHPYGSHWKDVGKFISNYSSFLQALGDSPAVDYDAFIADPVAEVNRKTKFEIEGEPVLVNHHQAETEPLGGDATALASDQIVSAPARVMITAAERGAISDAGLYDAYLAASARTLRQT